jgi:alkylhydroperoxidase family enzyme
MPHIEYDDAVLEYRPRVQAAWAELEKAFLSPDSVLSVSLKEELRKTIAEDRECRLCTTVGGASRGAADRQESLAVAYSSMIIADHKSINAATFEELRIEFSDEQIVELTAFIMFKIAGTTFNSIFDVRPATEKQREAFAELLAAAQG